MKRKSYFPRTLPIVSTNFSWIIIFCYTCLRHQAFSLTAGWTAYVTRPEAAKKFFLKTGTLCKKKNDSIKETFLIYPTMATDIFPKRPHSQARKDTILSKFIMGPNIITLAQGTQWKNQRMVSYYVFFITYYLKYFTFY